MARLRASLERNELDEAARLTHRFASSVGSISAMAAADLVATIERALQGVAPEAAVDLCEQLQETLERTDTKLRSVARLEDP